MRRALTVFSRVELTGAAAAFADLLRTSRPYGGAAAPSRVRAYADCDAETGAVA